MPMLFMGLGGWRVNKTRRSHIHQKCHMQEDFGAATNFPACCVKGPRLSRSLLKRSASRTPPPSRAPQAHMSQACSLLPTTIQMVKCASHPRALQQEQRPVCTFT